MLTELLDTRQVAEIYGLRRGWLEKARLTGEGPKFVKVSALVRYRRADVDAWIAANLRTSTSDPGPAQDVA